MKKKILTLASGDYSYWEHNGFIEFETLIRIKIPFAKDKGSPNLEVIAKFDEMGYDLVSESFTIMVFRKRKR